MALTTAPILRARRALPILSLLFEVLLTLFTQRHAPIGRHGIQNHIHALAIAVREGRAAERQTAS